MEIARLILSQLIDLWFKLADKIKLRTGRAGAQFGQFKLVTMASL
jgi:hypothetical protein